MPTAPSSPAVSEVGGANSTNTYSYKFNNYQEVNEFRRNWAAFLDGANATWYAPNITVCFNNALNFYQYDIDLLAIKLMYATFKESILNTTLMLQNSSDISYVCLDAGENLYVYSMYKFKQFGYDWTNVLLGGLQNALG